jgi:3-hydroxy acid dehydrogenase/malonic semialdehyde reductase
MEKTIFITGATSGIGWATAHAFSKKGYRLILTGRRQNRLDKLKNKLNCDLITLNFDVRDKTQVFNAIKSLPAEWKKIDVLINNAGNAHGLDTVQDASLQDWDAMIDGNVKGLMYVTKAIIPQMVNRNAGHIINMGSIAGLEVYPKGNVYCSSKFAVAAFTQGLRIDLNPFGIRVGIVHPGLVETEFSEVRFKGDQDRAEKVYAHLDALQASDIADAILYMVEAPSSVTIAELTILPTAQANAAIVNRKK